MLRQQFLNEIESARLMLHASGFKSIDYVCNAILNDSFIPETVVPVIISARGELYRENDPEQNPENPFDSWASGSTAVIPVTGIMLKHGYWWTYGMDDIASIISMAYNSNQIDSVIVKFDTPGGNTDSLFLLQEVLSARTKPTYGYVDGMCASCGYIAASYTDKIYAINPMARVGGVGVFARLIVPSEKNEHYRVVDAYPPESKDKNLPERELAKGNPELIRQELSKLAVYFQNIVKGNRPAVPGESLTGKMYYASESETLGMIDGVRTLAQVIDELTTLTESRKQILFNL